MPATGIETGLSRTIPALYPGQVLLPVVAFRPRDKSPAPSAADGGLSQSSRVQELEQRIQRDQLCYYSWVKSFIGIILLEKYLLRLKSGIGSLSDRRWLSAKTDGYS